MSKVEALSNNKAFAILPSTLVTKKEAMEMRENIIERILALTDEQIQDLLTLIQQAEEVSQVSEVPRQTSA